MKSQSILLAVRDPGDADDAVLLKAARLAGSGARVALFHAFALPYPLPSPLPTRPGAIVRKAEREKRAQLQALARRLRITGAQCAVAWDFPPAHAIVRRVLAARPDLVVAGSHRRNPLARRFLANADWELIRECPRPVWFVKGPRMSRKPIVLVAVDPAHARARSSGLDELLVRTARSVAERLDGRLALVHVVEAARAGAAGATPATKAALGRLAARGAVDPADVIVRSGTPAEIIPATAKRLGADLLVMGAVSRGGMPQVYIGGTAEAVIDGVTCDLLVVKPRGFRTSVPRRVERSL